MKSAWFGMMPEFMPHMVHIVDMAVNHLKTSFCCAVVQYFALIITDSFPSCNHQIFSCIKGNALKEIDWEHTKAVATRGGHIYINLKGRNPDNGQSGDILRGCILDKLLLWPWLPVYFRVVWHDARIYAPYGPHCVKT